MPLFSFLSSLGGSPIKALVKLALECLFDEKHWLFRRKRTA